METVAIATKLYSVQEYMDYELVAEYKHEYHDGELTTMPGGTKQHSEIGLNVASTLKFGLKGKTCKAYNSDQAIAIDDFNYVYPDVSVVCGEVQMGLLNQNAIANPTLIVEVLSANTADYDKGKKFDSYRNIKNFAEYVLIEQTRASVSVYTRLENDRWELRLYTNIEDVIGLQSINYNLPLKSIYDEIVF